MYRIAQSLVFTMCVVAPSVLLLSGIWRKTHQTGLVRPGQTVSPI